MSKGALGDVARQVAVMLGAIFQVAVAAWVGPAVGRVSGENPTLVVPGDYAFVIWAAIFLSLLTYTAYQERTRRLSERYRGSREDTGGIVRVSSELPQTEP
jgi:hypothetical protein